MNWLGQFVSDQRGRQHSGDLPHASRFPVVKGEYRRALVRRFPYAIFFAVVDDIVTVGCVFHTSQNPDKWRDRLG